METEAKWLCDCGKTYVQPVGNVKFPTRELCECGKTLYKLQEPDGIITEFVDAEEWFVKEFDEHNKKLKQIGVDVSKWSGMYFTAMERVNECRGKIKEASKKMNNIAEHGARRTKDRSGQGLLKRRDMAWEFNRMMSKWLGRKKPEVRK